MNTIRIVEGATLMSIGVFCASTLVGFALQSSNLLHANTGADVAIAAVPTVITVDIVGKRLSAEERIAMLKQDREAASKSTVVERSAVVHAG